MGDFRIAVDGADANRAADELAVVLADGEDPAVVSRSVVSLRPDEAAKTVDPVALVSMILAVPGAIIAAIDAADRIRKRRKAEALIATARRLHTEKHVMTTIIAPDGRTWSLDRIEADTVLEIADRTK